MISTTAAGGERTANEWMATMIASLADNKAALGRSYADWAVSAPTLESAVAAAAMAQDELGHARSTYPVLKGLGIETSDQGPGGNRRLALLDDGFPRWAAFIAANLVVDGTLTTFVTACEGSAVTPMAQRAKKILQEEGSHRVHGEAWARRLCSSDEQRDQFLELVVADWEEASRWLGPDDEEGAVEALTAGMISARPAAQRERMRSWLTDLFAGLGIELHLPEPTDWSGWQADTRRLDR